MSHFLIAVVILFCTHTNGLFVDKKVGIRRRQSPTVVVDDEIISLTGDHVEKYLILLYFSEKLLTINK